MKIKYEIDLNLDENNPQYVEITPEEAKPKSNTAHRELMRKYGANKAQRNKYAQSVGLALE